MPLPQLLVQERKMDPGPQRKSESESSGAQKLEQCKCTQSTLLVDRSRGPFPWTGPVDRAGGLGPWTVPVDWARGPCPWIVPVDCAYEPCPWTMPVDRARGLCPWTLPCALQSSLFYKARKENSLLLVQIQESQTITVFL